MSILTRLRTAENDIFPCSAAFTGVLGHEVIRASGDVLPSTSTAGQEDSTSRNGKMRPRNDSNAIPIFMLDYSSA